MRRKACHIQDKMEFSVYYLGFKPKWDFPPFINWTSPFMFKGLLGGTFPFYSNFMRNFCKQIVESLIRSGSALFAYVPQKGR